MISSDTQLTTDGVTLHLAQSWTVQSHLQKKDNFISIIKSTAVDKLHPFLSRMESLYTRGQLSTPDLCMFIKMASCASFAIHILRTRPELPILLSAARVFCVHWGKRPQTLENLLSECGGASGLINIISSLPMRIASKIFRIIGARGRKDKDTDDEALLRIQTVDFLIRATIPFLGPELPGASPPISRLASVVLNRVIPMGSESLLRALIPKFERSITAKLWKTLALRHPLLISELILIQLDASTNNSNLTWANDGILEYPNNLFPAVLLLSQTKNAGKDFLWKCLNSYASHIQTGDPVKHGDIFGIRSGVLWKLASNGLTARVLRDQDEKHQGMGHAIEILGVLKKIHAAEGKQRWSWEEVSPVLHCAISQFSRHKEEWVTPANAQASLSSELPTATMVLSTIFKNLDASAKFPPSFLSFLRRFPSEARSSFWFIAYFLRYSKDLTDGTIIPPHLSPFLLYILGPTAGEDILRRGFEAFGNKFLSAFPVPHSPDRYLDIVRNSFDTTLPTEVGEEHSVDAQWAVLHAAWLCTDVKRWKDIQTTSFNAGLEAAQRDVARFKSLATRARTGPERLAFLKVAFAIIYLTHNLYLLDDTLSWMAKRFAKDPEAGIGMWNWLLGSEYGYYRDDVELLTILSGPLIKRPREGDKPNSFVENLRQYFLSAGKVLRTLRMLLDLLAAEPGRSTDDMWQDYGKFLEKVIQERTQFVSELPDYLLKQADLRGAVYDDLSPIILSHGPMGRLAPHPVPTYIGNSDLLISTRLWEIIIPWVDELAAKVEDLYRAAFRSGLGEIINLPRRDQTFWPIRTILSTDSRIPIMYIGDVDFDISSTHYYRHLESWLFVSHSVLLSEPTGGFDGYHGHQRMQQYVEDYLTFSRSGDEASEKIQRLFYHYGPHPSSSMVGNTEDAHHWEDHSLLILGIPRVTKELKRSPHLSVALLDRLLPQYPSSETTVQVPRYDPLACMPKVPTMNALSILGKSVEHPTEPYRLSVFQTLLQELLTPNNTAIPPRHMERLAFLSVAHISTFHEIPTLQESEGKGPISDALRYFRLTNLKNFGSDNGGMTAECLLGRTLPYLAPPEIKKLISASTSLLLTEHTRGSIVELLDVLRRHPEPGLMVDLSFHVLADADSSSWHRHALTRSLLRTLRPANALSVMNRFLDFLDASRLEQLRRKAEFDEVRGSEVLIKDAPDGLKTKTELKISTIKMFLRLLSSGIEDGALPEDAYHLAYRVMEISTHRSVLEAVIDFFVQILHVQDIRGIPVANSLSEKNGLWTQLRSFVQMAARLAENVTITDEEWDAAQKGDTPMPIIDSSYSIATALLEVPGEFSPSLRNAWIDNILTPLLCGHVSNRTKWLKVALSREGGSDADVALIHGSFDAKMDVISIFQQILDYSLKGPTKECQEALLPIIEQHIRTQFSRRPFQTLISLAQAKHRDDSEAQTYFKDLRLLAAHALGYNTDFTRALSIVVQGIIKVQLEAVADFVGILERIGESLLAPENMLLGHDPQKNSSPFSCFLEMLPLLSPPVTSSDAQTQWHSRIRPLLVDFMKRTEDLERNQSQMTYNGGACYWPVIISLKLLLLPLPITLPYRTAHDRAEIYAQALNDLAKTILPYPGHRRLLSDYFLKPVVSGSHYSLADVLPICRSLTSISSSDSDDQDLRLLRFEIAIELVRAFSNQFMAYPEEMASANELMAAWFNDSDGMVRWLALHSVGNLVHDFSM